MNKSKELNLKLMIVFALGMLATFSELFILKASSQSTSKFILCSINCLRAKYYVGYNRTNIANLGNKKSYLQVKPDTIFLNISNATSKNILPDVDEKKVDREDGNFVSSTHRIENLQLGFSKKSEFMHVNTTLNNSYTKATVKLFWGDTFTVSSQTLANRVPVKVNIERIIGGFGNPVTDYVYYQANSKTFFNSKLIDDMNFNLKREPGVGQKDQILGKDKIIYTINTKVGDTFTVESLQEVTDGVKANTAGNQTLNGADSVLYKITLADKSSNSVCLKSASGSFKSGNCN